MQFAYLFLELALSIFQDRHSLYTNAPPEIDILREVNPRIIFIGIMIVCSNPH